jgi:hypothetical protein
MVVQILDLPPPVKSTGFDKYSENIELTPLPPVPFSELPNIELVVFNEPSIPEANKSLNQSDMAVTASSISPIESPSFVIKNIYMFLKLRHSR